MLTYRRFEAKDVENLKPIFEKFYSTEEFGLLNLQECYECPSYIAVKDDGQIRGFLMTGVWHHYNPTAGICYITHLAVSPKYRRNGHATNMIKLVQQESAKIYLDTFSDNIKAIGLYKKCGFKRVKRYVVEGQESSLFRWSKQDA